MTERPPDNEEPKGDDEGPCEGIVAAPASKPTIVEDTSRASTDQDKIRARDLLTEEASAALGVLLSIQKREIHAGPLPSPRILREFRDLYPDAPRIIFEEFEAQSAHRRKIEEAVIATNNKLAIRGSSHRRSARWNRSGW